MYTAQYTIPFATCVYYETYHALETENTYDKKLALSYQKNLLTVMYLQKYTKFLKEIFMFC